MEQRLTFLTAIIIGLLSLSCSQSSPTPVKNSSQSSSTKGMQGNQGPYSNDPNYAQNDTNNAEATSDDQDESSTSNEKSESKEEDQPSKKENLRM